MKILQCCLVIILLGMSGALFADRYQAKVIAVSDGDTIKVLNRQQVVKIRLAYIDAPEMGQPYGMQSKMALSDLIYKKVIEVEQVDTDQYKRAVCILHRSGKNINYEMIRSGHAWVYSRYNKDPTLVQAQREAKQQSLGLWRLSANQRIEPWIWRRDHRGGR